ncbi:MAG: protein jag [Oligoflexales bacterium]
MQKQQSKVRVTAKSLEEAISEAARDLGIPDENVDFEIVSQSNGGLFSFFGNKKVELLAWDKRGTKPEKKVVPDAKIEAPPPPRRAARSIAKDDGLDTDEVASEEPKVELTAEEVEALKEDLRNFCAEICSYIVGEKVEVRALVEDDRLVLDINNDEIMTQISKNTKLAESMEHILRKKPRYLKRELPFRIFVDVNGVRQKREQDLIEMAQDLSAKVSENKRPIVLNYKSSYDRKIIHMALDKDDRVYTKSIGSGPNRKLMILPATKKAGEQAEQQ